MRFTTNVDTTSILRSIFDVTKRQVEINAANLAGASAGNNHVRQDVLVSGRSIGGVFAGIEVERIYEAVDQVVIDNLRQQASSIGKLQAMDRYHSETEQLFGTRGTGQTFVNKLETMLEGMRTMAANPTSPGAAMTLVDAADMHAHSVADLAANVQQIRAEINQDISDKIDEANRLIESITDLNKQISLTILETGDATSIFAYTKTQRDQIQKLVGIIGGSACIDSRNQIRYVTDNGELVIDGINCAKFHYDPSTAMVAGQALNPLTLVGFDQTIDVTNSIQQSAAQGYVSGLFVMGNQKLPAFQQQLDEYAVTLANALNAIHNQGISGNPSTQLIGTVGAPGLLGPLVGTDVISGSGTLRVGVFNPANGNLVDHVDVVLNDNMTIDDLIAALSGHGFTADLTAEGQFRLRSNNPAYGVVIGSGDPATLPKLCAGDAFVEGNSYGASHFFGLNNFLTVTPLPGASTTGAAQSLAVRSDIYAANGSNISVGPLSSGTPPSTPAFSAHNITTIQAMGDQIDTMTFSFAATSVSAAVTKTVKDYARSINEIQVKLASDNRKLLEPAQRSFEQLSNNADNIMGANPKQIMLDNLRLSTLQAIATRGLNLHYEMERKILEIH